MYTVTMLRGPNQPLTRTNEDLAGAENRVLHLCELHGVERNTVVYDSENKRFIINANAYYGSETCAGGMHSWVNETGKLPADTRCTVCGEPYGDPD